MSQITTNAGTTTSATSTADAAALERERIEEARIAWEINQNRASLVYLDGQASEHRSKADRMRQLAEGLTAELVPLRTSFNPIRQLHVTTTWQGQAATASRLRLDELETRNITAIRTIDFLIDDLETQANWHAGEVVDIESQVDHVRRAIWNLEQQR